MASIVIVSGPNEGDYYPLGSRTMVVGRDESCPVQLVDRLVSRKHLQIRQDPGSGRFYALDMKSANGVFVNGRKITADTVLADGDVVELGASKLLFTLLDFKDRQSAIDHYKRRGERGKSTLIE